MDGAPGHWSRQVRDWMDQTFPESWVGRGGPVAWPPRSPDLTPPDFFLWGYVKNLVYGKNPSSIQELQTSISEVFSVIDVSICETVCQSVESRFQRCIEADGAQIQ